MSIPSSDRVEYAVSSRGSETYPQNVIAKSTLWTLQLSNGRLLLQEYSGYFVVIPTYIISRFLLTRALKSDRTIDSNKFWVWYVDFSGNLSLVEMEPFTTVIPSVTYTKTSIAANIAGFSVFVRDSDAIRIIALNNSGVFSALRFNNIKVDPTPTTTVLTWSGTRLPDFYSFTSEEATRLDIAYLDVLSPPNIFTDSYTVPIPTGLTGYQVLGTFSMQMSWNASAGSDNYVLERATDAAFTIDLTTVYDGPLLTILDATPGPATYYYRVLAQVTSLALNSFWSSTFSYPVIITAIDFVGVPTSGYIPLDVQFTYLGTVVSGMTFAWDFGDGHTSALSDPLYTYMTAGIYTVSLTISVPGGSASTTKPNYITAIAPHPVADFTATPTDAEYPLVVQFTDTSTTLTPSTITAWSWDFGDGTTAVTQNPIHTYNIPGFYTVSLIATNSYGLTDTETKVDFIRVRNITLIVDFVGVPRSGEASLIVDFTNLTQIPPGHTAMGWLWSFGDGSTSTEENPTHMYINKGFFTVILKAYVSL